MSDAAKKLSTEVEAPKDVKARVVTASPFPNRPGAVNGGRRRVPRRPVDRAIGLLVGGVYSLARAYEVGEGGILIDAPTLLKKGQRAVITFRIPGVLHGVMLARVVYVLEPKAPGEIRRYGVQFDDVAFEVKRKIRNFVASSTGINLDARNEELEAALSGVVLS